ncbi:hypothetical protein SISNIDRAFT_419820 [Sistotremastrum niveocremeum HHB9708]|uniref:CBS domain-containing protein n=1 Tax=Sistotremastrum niveocremeum HHB9708 TaxID=1314777 RepID=A0A164N203_9AGAM|nr:hypothetical protein SISNIDRAFT_419820 [Sistotremastrum niveocremeum HHB9708]
MSSLRRRRSHFSPSSPSSPNNTSLPTTDSRELVDSWSQIKAKDLIDSPLYEIEADASVEAACESLLTHGTLCLAIKASQLSPNGRPYSGLFDYADVNAFLTLAATQHALTPEDLEENPRLSEILIAAKSGHVPVHLVGDLSDKNPLVLLQHDATLLDLLQVFSRGTHRVLIETEDGRPAGMVSDLSLVGWFLAHCNDYPNLHSTLEAAIAQLGLYTNHVVSLPADSVLLDAMKILSEQGLSSVAIVNPLDGYLLSAVSVTDIGKIVVPSQSKAILTVPLGDFIKQIKEPAGADDGVDRYPVYAVGLSSSLMFAMQKLVATNAHRVFVAEEAMEEQCLVGTRGNLRGVISVVDVLARFATMASIETDPRRMQRHRRASSTSSSRSRSSGSVDVHSR